MILKEIDERRAYRALSERPIEKEGLISHPIAGFDALGLRKALGMDESLILLTLIILGYPGDEEHLSEKPRIQEHAPRERKALEELVSFNSLSL